MDIHTCHFPVVAIIPSLNPDAQLEKVIDGLQGAGFSDVIVVDDGSREECRGIFDSIAKKPGCVVLRHDVNQGKGRALKTAFFYYLNNYDQSRYAGVVTADADGQHLPEDIRKTAEALLGPDGQNTLSLGTRNFNEENVPFKSRNGNKITTIVFRLLYSRQVNDTQTGLRAIPNQFLTPCLDIRGERFEYEINMLIMAVRRGLKMVEVPIQTVYFDSNRETHFDAVRDSAKIYGVMFSSFLRFSCSGLASVLVDQGLFALLQKLVFAWLADTVSIPLSTLIARVCSSLLNYSMNRSLVFDAKGSPRGKTLLRYYILCAAQMAVSAGCVTALRLITRADASLLKLIVDLVLFFISYRIQQRWVFREG